MNNDKKLPDFSNNENEQFGQRLARALAKLRDVALELHDGQTFQETIRKSRGLYDMPPSVVHWLSGQVGWRLDWRRRHKVGMTQVPRQTIIQLYVDQHWTLERIGNLTHTSRERIRQVLTAEGVDVHEVYLKRAAAQKELKLEQRKKDRSAKAEARRIKIEARYAPILTAYAEGQPMRELARMAGTTMASFMTSVYYLRASKGWFLPLRRPHA